METAGTEVTLIRCRNNMEKSTRRTHRYFVNFESQIHVAIFRSNRYHNFHVDSPFKIDVITTNYFLKFRRRIDGESTKMCPLGSVFQMLLSMYLLIVHNFENSWYQVTLRIALLKPLPWPWRKSFSMKCYFYR